jgi:mxaL protein
MNVASFRDLRFWLIAGALVSALATLIVPRISLNRNVYDVLAVLDITASMNTRDLSALGTAESRLDAAKDALRTTLSKMPCQSHLGLAIFTERQSFLLFNPVEVCSNYAAIDDAISEISWRMGWEGSSYVAKGLYSAIDIAKSLKADLLFFTDGHEMPPLPYTGLPPFEGKIGEVGGLIVGVGGNTRVPLTRYDDEGREAGSYGVRDVPQENRQGPPPPDAASRPGYHPKWAPFGDELIDNSEHLAFIREPHLKDLARLTGLHYVLLHANENLVPILSRTVEPRPVTVAADIRPYPAALALCFLLGLYGFLPFLSAVRPHGSPASVSNPRNNWSLPNAS